MSVTGSAWRRHGVEGFPTPFCVTDIAFGGYHSVRNAGRCAVKRLFMLVLALLVAGEAWAATVVLTGGKRIDVASYTVSGSYVTVQYANGRRESYPLSVVDLPATRDASGAKPSAAATPEPSGPHSPFLGARSSTGAGAVVVTDADVKHVEAPEAEEEK
jgi:hypothetical protein